MEITGLKGTIEQRGKGSFRVRLSLGKNSEGKYDTKQETIRGTQKQAVELLTRWNVEYLNNELAATNHETINQLVNQWLKHVEEYREYNTHFFYVNRAKDICREVGHKKLKDVSLKDLQNIMAKHPTKSRHNKRALSAFYSYCVKHRKCKDNPCRHLETSARSKKQTESDVWNFDQIRTVYANLDFGNLYDIFLVFGIECGMRPQEILALTWSKIHDGVIIIDEAVKQRNPAQFQISGTKTGIERLIYATPYLLSQLGIHRTKQEKRKESNSSYVDQDLIVADSNGSVPDLKYIRKYMLALADRIGVPLIPPKNLRSTHISLLNDLQIPLSVLEKQVGHTGPDMIKRHYLRIYGESLKNATMLLDEKLHPRPISSN